MEARKVTKSATYCLAGATHSKLIISHDELKLLFNHIEAEFCQSEVYQKAFDGLQKRLGNAPKWVHLLIKAIGREAIRLTLRQIISQFQVEEAPCQPEGQPYQNEQHQPQHLDRLPQPATQHQSHSHQVQGDFHRDKRHHQEPIASARPLASPAEAHSNVSQHPISAVVSPTTSNTYSSEDTAAMPLVSDSASSTRRPHSSTVEPPDNSASVASSQQSRAIAPPDGSNQVGQHKPPSPPKRVTLPSQTSANPFVKRKPDASSIQETVEAAYKDIGARLKQARLEKSLTVRQVHEQTKVGIHQIEAIECGNLERLPEEIYVEGFIRQIARSVGVDYDSLMACLPQKAIKPTDIPLRSTRVPSVSARPVSSRRNVFRPAHLYIGYAALLASATGGLIWANHSQSAAQLDQFDLPIDLPPIDLPQMFDDFKSIFNTEGTVQNQSNPHEQRTVPEAIATPEVITVESSMSGN
jgi:transcriptional regulator with XRE-family HTH domain